MLPVITVFPFHFGFSYLKNYLYCCWNSYFEENLYSFFIFTSLIISNCPPCEMQNLELHKIDSTFSSTSSMKEYSLLILSLWWPYILYFTSLPFRFIFFLKWWFCLLFCELNTSAQHDTVHVHRNMTLVIFCDSVMFVSPMKRSKNDKFCQYRWIRIFKYFR